MLQLTMNEINYTPKKLQIIQNMLVIQSSYFNPNWKLGMKYNSSLHQKSFN